MSRIYNTSEKKWNGMGTFIEKEDTLGRAVQARKLLRRLRKSCKQSVVEDLEMTGLNE